MCLMRVISSYLSLFAFFATTAFAGESDFLRRWQNLFSRVAHQKTRSSAILREAESIRRQYAPSLPAHYFEELEKHPFLSYARLKRLSEQHVAFETELSYVDALIALNVPFENLSIDAQKRLNSFLADLIQARQKQEFFLSEQWFTEHVSNPFYWRTWDREGKLVASYIDSLDANLFVFAGGYRGNLHLPSLKPIGDLLLTYSIRSVESKLHRVRSQMAHGQLTPSEYSQFSVQEEELIGEVTRLLLGIPFESAYAPSIRFVLEAAGSNNYRWIALLRYLVAQADAYFDTDAASIDVVMDQMQHFGMPTAWQKSMREALTRAANSNEKLAVGLEKILKQIERERVFVRDPMCGVSLRNVFDRILGRPRLR